MDLDFNEPTADSSNESAPALPISPAQSAPTPSVAVPQPASDTPSLPPAPPPSPPSAPPVLPPPPEQPAGSPTASPPLSDVNSSQASELPEIKDSPTATPTPQKGSGLVKWLVVILVIAALGGVAYYLLVTESGRSLVGLSSTGSEKVIESDSLDTIGTATDTGLATDIGASNSSDPIAQRDAARKQDLATIQSYLEDYKAAQGSYPSASSVEKVDDPASDVYAVLVPDYASSLPADPLSQSGYWYGYKSDGSTYELTARLEDTADPSASLVGSVYLYQLKNLSGSSSGIGS